MEESDEEAADEGEKINVWNKRLALLLIQLYAPFV